MDISNIQNAQSTQNSKQLIDYPQWPDNHSPSIHDSIQQSYISAHTLPKTANTPVKPSLSLTKSAKWSVEKLAKLGRYFRSDISSHPVISTLQASAGFETARQHVITPKLKGLSRIGTRFIDFGGKTLDALSGVTSALGQFSHDYDSGERTYSRTMKRILASVCQTSLSYAVTIGATNAASTLLIGTAATGAIPWIIGGAMALGVGYGVNKVINRFADLN